MLREDDSAARKVEKLTRINQVLIDRIDRLEESRGSAWSMFQAAVALEQEVLTRTRQLEQAMADLSQRNRELAVARRGPPKRPTARRPGSCVQPATICCNRFRPRGCSCRH